MTLDARAVLGVLSAQPPLPVRPCRTMGPLTLPWHTCGRCSGYRACELTASIAAADGPKALPEPTGRFIHHQASFRSEATATRFKRMAPRSTARSYVYPRERLTVERAHTIEVARCNVSEHSFSLRAKKPASEEGPSSPSSSQGLSGLSSVKRRAPPAAPCALRPAPCALRSGHVLS